MLGYYTDCKFYSGSYIPTAVFHILGSRKHHEAGFENENLEEMF